LYAFESGKCLPSDNVLQKISKYLNVRIDEILRPSYSQDKELMMRAMQIVVNSLEGCAYSIDFKSEVGLKVFSNLVNLRKEPLNDHDVNELIEDLEIQKVANKCLINYLKKEYLPTTKLL
jgi:transcriptional regulator with XRE-family HTH domain